MWEKIKHNFKLRVSGFGLRGGFTLIEMLVVLFVVAVISSLLIASYRTGQKQYALDEAAQNLVSDLRLVQSMAMSGTGIYQSYYNYGIYFKKNASSYQLFGDKDNDCFYTSTGNPNQRDTVIETTQLPQNVIIAQVSPAVTPPGLHVCFAPPAPTTYFNQVNNPSSVPQASITIQYGSDAALVKTVIINSAGAVKVQ